MTGMNPCSVVIENEFDVEAYRSDLQRRIDTLTAMERSYHDQWMGGDDMEHYHAANRCADKARGLEIALSLLPPAPTPPSPAHRRRAWYRPGGVLR